MKRRIAMENKVEFKSLELVAKMAAHLQVTRDEYVEAAILNDGKDFVRAFRGNIRVEIHNRDNGLCFYCGSPVAIEKMHVDHVIPFVLGGRTIESNGVVACPKCNLKKSKKVW